MSLAPGTRIGPFEITGVLGAGAMGEVYLARDSRLGREAALKLLPVSLASDPDRVARFIREAQVLASLSHPNIGGIYGLEETGGTTAPIRALVLELIGGETLADRIRRGPIPVDDALPIIRQIAEALQAAHDQGVIHRDLKPANIKITPEGVVKVLDFGLAKLSGPADLRVTSEAGEAFASAAATFAGTSSNDAPTIMGPAATSVGAIVGTAAYMSPEQAKARTADKRSDVWALGCVMYEILTGKHPFLGEDVADTLAGVMRIEPDWTRLPMELPASVADVLRKCLEKDRRRRVGDMAAILFALDQPSRTASETPAASSGGLRRIVTTAAACLIAAAVAGAAVWALTRPAPGAVTMLAIAPDEEHAFTTSTGSREVAISNDGKRVVYFGGGERVVYFGGGGRLIVRALDSLESTVIEGLEGPQSPFFSPDGQSIAFIRRNSDLRLVPAAGGPSEQLIGLDSAQSGGGSFSEDGRIVYATTNRLTGLLELTPGASKPNVLTTPNRNRGEADHLWPEFLPGGRAALFTITQLDGQPGTGQVAVYDFETKTTSIVVSPGTHAQYVATGHLVYSAGGALRAIRFDPRTLKTTGKSAVVVPAVQTKALGAANFDISDNGTLIYAAGGVAESFARRELVWVTRDGSVQTLGAPLRAYQYPRLSPDGTRVVLDIRDQDNDLWIWDLRTRTLARFTDAPGLDRFPLWTPDGKHIVFVSDRSGSSAIYRQPADGGGAAEPLTEGTPEQQTPDDITDDSKQLIFGFRGDIHSFLLDGSRRQSPLFETPAQEYRSTVSPDREWIAYHSNESGKMEVYVRSFASPGSGKWQVSPDGGVEAWWGPKSDELFYVSTATQQLMSVRVAPGNEWRPGPPAVVFKDPYFWGTTTGAAAATFDIASDGRRLLMIRHLRDPDAPPVASNLIVVQNWFEELKRLVP